MESFNTDAPVVLLNEQSELIAMANDLKLDGIAAELEDQMSNPVIFNGMKFEERIKKCLESQKAEELSKTFEKLYRKSKLPRKIYLSQIASSMPKGLLPEKLALLAETNYIKQGVNIVITGATGVGKSALSIAAAIEAIRKGYTVRYFRMMELISILNAKVDDSFIRFRELLHRTDVLLIDDFGGCMLEDDIVAKLNEIVDARYNEGATIITTQLRMSNMKEVIKTQGPICDAFCNRLFRNSDIEIRLTGASWRGRPEEIRGAK